MLAPPVVLRQPPLAAASLWDRVDWVTDTDAAYTQPPLPPVVRRLSMDTLNISTELVEKIPPPLPAVCAAVRPMPSSLIGAAALMIPCVDPPLMVRLISSSGPKNCTGSSASMISGPPVRVIMPVTLKKMLSLPLLVPASQPSTTTPVLAVAIASRSWHSAAVPPVSVRTSTVISAPNAEAWPNPSTATIVPAATNVLTPEALILEESECTREGGQAGATS